MFFFPLVPFARVSAECDDSNRGSVQVLVRKADLTNGRQLRLRTKARLRDGFSVAERTNHSWIRSYLESLDLPREDADRAIERCSSGVDF